ncbi:MAG: peptide chain release factor 2, partial [Anaerolinea sp.]|nr:peptide chain release factor 2 [Anaerolinea sp.]
MEELQKKSEDPHLWDDPKQAQQLMKSLSDLRDEINLWTSLERRISDTLELSSMEDPTLNDELELETRKIKQELERLSLSTLLGGKYDRGNALLTINTGEGGTDAQDWAGMLERMYLRWCERKGYQTEILDQTEGEEAGIKTVSIA